MTNGSRAEKSGPFLRPAVLADLGAVQAVVREGYTPYIARMGQKPGPMLADYAALIGAGAVTLAERDGRVAGVLVLLDRAGYLLLDNVVVDPAQQGQGVGRALLVHAEHEARRRGRPEIRLYTNALMTENIQMYARAGFVETDRRVEDGYHRVFFAKAVP